MQQNQPTLERSQHTSGTHSRHHSHHRAPSTRPSRHTRHRSFWRVVTRWLSRQGKLLAAEIVAGAVIAVLLVTYINRWNGPSVEVQQAVYQARKQASHPADAHDARNRAIYQEILAAEKRAAAEARRRVPDLAPGSPGYTPAKAERQAQHQVETEAVLEGRYRASIMAERHLTPEELRAIEDQGRTAGW
ncbi:MAG: hypothetical protein ACP5VE_07895 [Chthonomonadales bacterium]